LEYLLETHESVEDGITGTRLSTKYEPVADTTFLCITTLTTLGFTTVTALCFTLTTLCFTTLTTNSALVCHRHILAAMHLSLGAKSWYSQRESKLREARPVFQGIKLQRADVMGSLLALLHITGVDNHI
jgi:hypothetical protein